MLERDRQGYRDGKMLEKERERDEFMRFWLFERPDYFHPRVLSSRATII